jgi:tetratricopeptide (TPR) repeat protein
LYQKGLNLISVEKNIDNGIVMIKDSVVLNPYNDLYLRALAQAALLRVNAELAKPQSAERDSQVQNLIATAINIGKRTTDLSPLNVENWSQRASIYRSVMGYISGSEQWAFDAYKEASVLEPQNPYYYLELGRTYILAADLLTEVAQKDKEKAATMNDYLDQADISLSKAIKAKADYAPALYQQSLVFDRQGKIDAAIAKMIETKISYPQDTGVAFQLGLLYYKKASWEAARVEFERAILLDENYSNARYFLGLIYEKQGERAKAIDQFEKVLKLNPDNQEIKTIIANLQAGRAAISQPSAQPNEVPIQ